MQAALEATRNRVAVDIGQSLNDVTLLTKQHFAVVRSLISGDVIAAVRVLVLALDDDGTTERLQHVTMLREDCQELLDLRSILLNSSVKLQELYQDMTETQTLITEHMASAVAAQASNVDVTNLGGKKQFLDSLRTELLVVEHGTSRQAYTYAAPLRSSSCREPPHYPRERLGGITNGGAKARFVP